MTKGRTRTGLLAIVLAIVVFVASPGCRTIKTNLGLGDEVSETVEGSPERALQEVLRAGMEKDYETGWQILKRQLCKEQRTKGSLATWKDTKYSSLRKKAKLYVVDDEKMSFVIQRVVDEDRGKVSYYLENSGNPENPTPCTLVQDEEGGPWRVSRCSL